MERGEDTKSGGEGRRDARTRQISVMSPSNISFKIFTKRNLRFIKVGECNWRSEKQREREKEGKQRKVIATPSLRHIGRLLFLYLPLRPRSAGCEERRRQLLKMESSLCRVGTKAEGRKGGKKEGEDMLDDVFLPRMKNTKDFP